MILKSAKQAELAIVQTKWMKEALQNKAKTDPAKILVAFPDIVDCGKKVDQEHFDQTRFFFIRRLKAYIRIRPASIRHAPF